MARNQDVPLPMLLEGGALVALQLDLKTGTVDTLELAERPCRERASLGSTPKVVAAVAACIRVATIRENFLDLPLPAASDVLHEHERSSLTVLFALTFCSLRFVPSSAVVGKLFYLSCGSRPLMPPLPTLCSVVCQRFPTYGI
jgi:hypothetical protein